MKKIKFIMCLIIFILLIGYSSSEAGFFTSAIEKEALKIAESYYSKRIIKCGDAYFVIESSYAGRVLHLYMPKKPYKIEMTSDNLSEVDKKNGKEFSGRFTVIFPKKTLHRSYQYYNGRARYPDDDKWSEWNESSGDKEVFFGLDKLKGKWIHRGGYVGSQDIICPDVPKGYKE